MFFNDETSTVFYTLSLHDALPIYHLQSGAHVRAGSQAPSSRRTLPILQRAFASRRTRSLKNRKDRKSTRLNSSHLGISYAVFCLKKKIYNNSITSASHEKDNRVYT